MDEEKDLGEDLFKGDNLFNIEPISDTANMGPMVHLFDEGNYRVMGQEVEIFWRWVIYRGPHPIQEGVSLSEKAARRAAQSCLVYFKQVDDRVEGHFSGRESQAEGEGEGARRRPFWDE